MDDGAELGIVERGITDFTARDVEVVMQEYTHLSLVSREILDSHLAQQDIGLEVDGVTQGQFDADFGVAQHRATYERAILVADVALPGLVSPVRTSFDPDAQTKGIPFGVILDADVRKINVADPVVLVEIQQEVPVAEHQRARHCVLPPQGYSPPNASSKSKTCSKSLIKSSSCLIRMPASTRANTMRPTSA